MVLAVGLDKFWSLASLVSMPFGGTYAAKSLPQGTWRPLWLSWAPLGCVLGALGGVFEAYQGVWKLLGTLAGILEPSCTRPGASCEPGGDISSALGAVWEAS